MNEHDDDLDDLFRRYVRRGDAQALGRAFDASWEELLRIASHFAGRPDEAEDLVQATWLTAIEKARELDPSRRLIPWLVSILALHARELARKRRREIDPARLDPRSAEAAEQRVEALELAESVRAALAEIPPSYRDALVRHLRGARAVDIAAATGQRAATVRMQLHRGFEHLRKALPAGLAFGAAFQLVPTRGSAAVRESVLAHARSLPALPLATAGGVTKALTATACVGLLVGALWWIARREPSNATAATAASIESSSPRALVAVADPAPTAEVAVREDVHRVEAPAENTSIAAPEEPHLAGRLLDADGSPIPDTEVVLVEFDLQRIAWSWTEDEFVRSSSRTDERGRFQLDRARSRPIHLLAVDPGGPRGSLHVLEQSIASRGATEIGDVLLPEGRALRGAVVDEDGAPVAGARVRAVALPEALREWWDPITDCAAGGVGARSTFGMFRGRLARADVFDAPAGVKRWLDRLPVPTVATDARGEFVLPHVPSGLVTLIADAPHRTPAVRKVEDEAQLGEALVLRPALDLSGLVVDANGSPVAGAEVILGSGAGFGSPASAFAAGLRTSADREGRFIASGIAAGPLGALARRHDGDPWTLLRPLDASRPLVLQLPATERVSLEVVDSSGAPQARACASLVDLGTSFDRPADSQRNWCADARGRIELELARGRSLATLVHSPGLAAKLVGLPKSRSDEPLRVVLSAANPVDIRVVDATDQRPIERTEIAVLLRGQGPRIAGAWSDATGLARLEAIDLTGFEAKIHVERDGYAPAEVPWTNASTSVSLAPPGSVAIRARFEGQPVEATVMFELPVDVLLLAATGPDLVSRAELAAGDYRYQLQPRGSNAAIWDWLSAHIQSAEHVCASGEVHVESGATTELEVDLPLPLEPVGRSDELARIQGTVRIDGEPAARVDITRIAFRGGAFRIDAKTSTDERGAFTFAGVRRGSYLLMVGSESSTMAQREVEVSTATLRVDLDLHSTRVEVELVDGSGASVAGATVFVERPSDRRWPYGSRRTGEDGRATIEIAEAGRYLVSARDARVGEGSAVVEVDELGGQRSSRIVLERGVAFGGTCEFPAAGASLEGVAQLMLQAAGSQRSRSIELKRDGERWTFSQVGLRAGSYRAWCWNGATTLGPLEIELGPNGDEALTLRFEERR